MRRMFIGLCLLFMLVGCNSFEDMKDFLKKQELIQEAIREETGWESQVGYNMHNGVLTNVSVTLDANDVRDKKVSELENLVRRVVTGSFKSTPGAIYIQIATTI